MTRELIIECMTCKDKCEEEDSCFECAKKQLAEYENQIRADERGKVLDEVDTIIDFIKNNSFDHSLEFDSFKAIGSSVAISLLEQLKEQE